MRAQTAIVVLGAWLSVASVQAADSFPYKAYVTASDTYVRSGPAEKYYPTDRLRRGDEVEVYRHDAGDWYAIRPTEGSFSWIPGRHLEGAGTGLARVLTEDVPARVGSRFSDIRHLAQVRLHKGEIVEVLEARDFPPGQDGGRWYKISPPSGEFRWVDGRSLSRVPPANADPATQENVVVLPHPVATDAAEPSSTATAPSAASVPANNVKPLPPVAPQGSGSTTSGWQPQGSVRTSSPAASNGPAMTPGRQTAGASGRSISPEEFRAQLDQLELDLSLMLVEEPTVWHLDEMQSRALDLLSVAESPEERQRARALSAKIEQSKDLKNRFTLVAELRPATARQVVTLPPASNAAGVVAVAPPAAAAVPPMTANPANSLGLTVPPPLQTAAAPAAVPAGRYDGTGRLARVVSPKVGAPQYALVDEQGQVRCYVTPAPGVTMQYYVGRQIGINGTRGYSPEQKSEQVMAKHITPLDGTLVR
jgi:hypothetical protein